MSDKDGELQPPLIETVVEDMDERGHSFSYRTVDTQSYLLPQRRNRVFGCAAAKRAKTPEEIELESKSWKDTFARLGMGPKEQQFDLTDLLEDGLDAEPLQAPQDIQNWKAAKANVKRTKGKAQAQPMCLHMGSSSDRLEYALGASTCVRPTHGIYCEVVQRPLVPLELLRLQGVFPSDFPFPDAIEAVSEKLLKDMAGNAFTTTVLQAAMLASLVSHDAWCHLSTEAKADTSRRRNRKRRQPPTDEDGENGGPRGKGKGFGGNDPKLAKYEPLFYLWLKFNTHI